MCGICCLLTPKNSDGISSLKDCMEHSIIRHRGPNVTDTKEVKVNGTYCLTLTGHVLHLRGQLTKQPLQHQNGDLLLWNAEIFGGIMVDEEENDTEVLLQLLSKEVTTDHIITTLASVEGPWSFIYWQNSTQTLFFGRDMFGRRSLLWHLPKTKEDVFLLSSVKLDNYEFTEVPSVGLFSVCVKNEIVTMTMYPRDEAVWPGTSVKVKESYQGHIDVVQTPHFHFTLDEGQVVPMSIPKLNREVLGPPALIYSKNDEMNTMNSNVEMQHIDAHSVCNSDLTVDKCATGNAPTFQRYVVLEEIIANPQRYLENILQNETFMNKLSDQLIDVLLKAVTTRVYNQVDLPRKTKPCDVCKNGHRSTQQIGGSKNKTSEESNFNSGSLCHSDSEVLDTGLHLNGSVSTKSETLNYLESKDNRTVGCEKSGTDASKVDSIDCSTGYMTNCTQASGGDVINGKAKVAVLFSGGIDSAVITALVDRCLPIEEPVDLLNVAFEQKVKVQTKKKGSRKPDPEKSDISWDVPDRITGYTALAELNPNRPWNFIEVNVTVKELQEVRSNHIQHLVYPLETVLDDSIGCAVWFAARGHGVLGNTEQRGQSYQSTSKVILCGMGADEQLAGYSRHRGKFMEHGIHGLLDEIEMEVNRISARNLGRDDRIITDHGKESRFPFLDENVVSYLQSLPIQYKADLSLPRGIGEKLLLRLCAIKLGLVKTATFPKRAIQFGSRIAKTENSKEKGSDKCQRLQTDIRN